MRDLLAKPLIVVTGKGGVGKSTVAAALGVAAAAQGLRTIIAEVAARDDISRALAAGSARPSGPSPSARWATGCTTSRSTRSRRWRSTCATSCRAASPSCSGRSRMFAYLAAATPGLRELLTIGKVWELAQPDRRTPGAHPYDLVILDAPATGHGVAILTAPGTFAGAARMGPVARQGGIIHEMLADPAADRHRRRGPARGDARQRDARPAGRARHRAGPALRRRGRQRRAAPRFTGAEAARLAGARARARRAREAGRARGHQGQLARLRRGLEGVACTTLPR